MSPWYQDRGGFGGEYHPQRCVAVDRYDFDTVDAVDDCPDADPLVECVLCEHDIGPDIQRLAPEARSIVDVLTQERFGVDDREWTNRHFDPIRTIDAVTEGRLTDEGFLDANRGAEVVSLQDWQAKRRDAADTTLFEFLLRDAIEAHLVFYREYKGYSDDEIFLDEVLSESGTSADDCAQNVAKTWEWLQDIGVPEAPTDRQADLGEFAGGGEA